MSTISPGRLRTVAGVSDVLSALGTNLEVLSEEIFKFKPTYQNGSVTTLIGPPTSGDRILDERWKDSLGAQWKCTAAGTPGTWRQESPAIVASPPASGTIPTNYQILDAAASYAQKYHAGAYVWTSVYATSATTSGLNNGRVPRYQGGVFVDSIIREDGTQVAIAAAIDAAQLAFQVTGGISLIGASTFKTSAGLLTITGTAGVTVTTASNNNVTISPNGVGYVSVTSAVEATTGGAGSIITSGGIYTAKAIVVGSATASSSITTGSLIVGGGAGISGKIYVGSDASIAGNLTFTGAQTISTSAGALTLAPFAGSDLTVNVTSTGKLQVNGNITMTGQAAVPCVLQQTAVTTYSAYQNIQNATGLIQIGVESSSGNYMGTGYSAYASVLQSNGAYPLCFGTTATARFIIAAASSTLTGQGASTITTSSGILTVTGTGGLTLTSGSSNTLLTQNSVNVFTSEGSGAVATTLYLKTGLVGVGESPFCKFHVFKPGAGSLGIVADFGILVRNNNNVVGDLTQIGIGRAPGTYASTVIGTVMASATGSGNDDFFIATRALTTDTAPIERVRVTSAGNVGIGTAAPTSVLHLKAGTATASTAPFKFTTGTNLITAEAGAMEYNNTFHLTNSDATRRHICLAPNTTKVTAGAPYTNDGYVVVNIGGTDFKVMTTA